MLFRQESKIKVLFRKQIKTVNLTFLSSQTDTWRIAIKLPECFYILCMWFF